MTLTQAIEAAREALDYYRRSATKQVHGYTEEDGDDAREALAALPEPMTELEIDAVIRYEVCNNTSVDKCVSEIISRLKSHNVLFVKE